MGVPDDASSQRERIFHMSRLADEEFQALRRRAYGPSADIHLDPSALARLRELEGASRPNPLPRLDPENPVETERQFPLELQIPVNEELERRGNERLRRFMLRGRLALRRLARIRRSTVVIVLGLAVTATATIVALILVQRVQADPLLVGAEQVARLSVDSSFEVPGVFGPNGAQAYQEFHGFRPIVNDGTRYGGNAGDSCMNVFSSADLATATANSFSGFALGACEAGAFPAAVQFRPDGQGAPNEKELQSAFPDATAIQFVYDKVHNEVVVFLSE